MKANKKNVTQEVTVAAVPVPVKKNDVVNCSKCGAALTAKNAGAAYICPVCGTLFRTRTCIRIVQEKPVEEKQIHLSLTKKAAKFITGKDPLAKDAGKASRKEAKLRAKRERAFGAVLAEYVEAALYGEENAKAKTKAEARREEKVNKKRNKLFGELTSKKIDFAGMKEGDVILVDYENNGLVITKKAPSEEKTAE